MSFLFHKKEGSGAAALGRLGCDMHSHLIPGIDDGVRDMDMALEMIRGLSALGYKKLITTPHVLSGVYPNTPGIIGTGYRSVAEEITKQQIPIELFAAAEYMMDEQFSDLLDTDQPLLTLKDNLVLVELSFVVPAINLKELLFRMQIKGYQPVLAHPERYLYFSADKDAFKQLKGAGCLFQVNLLSLIGHYGKSSKELAQWLIKKKYVDLLGTDLHHERHLRALHSRELTDAVDKIIDTCQLLNMQF